jgi:23S rRNA (uridine2552-2'-O)-methyltransferase
MPGRRHGSRNRAGGQRRSRGSGSGYDRKDAFYRRAKQEGYRSRASYKLLELAERYQLIRRGSRVLDLGCWPGGWLQVAVAIAGPSGTIVGIDLRATDPVAGAMALQGDITDPEVLEKLRDAVPGGAYDAVLSDLAPKLSGVRFSDEARAAELNQTALAVAESLLAPGGTLLMKTFMSGETEEMLRRARKVFASVRLTNAEASRKGSAEHYLIARDRRTRDSSEELQ